MKKIIIIPTIVLSIFFLQSSLQNSIVCASGKFENEDEIRKELWEEFHKIRYEKFGKFQEIDLYAVNQSFTRICYIADKGLFMFYYKDPNTEGKSHIEPVEHAKAVFYDKINRITYERNKDVNIGFFQLWYYETLELSLGGD